MVVILGKNKVLYISVIITIRDIIIIPLLQAIKDSIIKIETITLFLILYFVYTCLNHALCV